MVVISPTRAGERARAGALSSSSVNEFVQQRQCFSASIAFVPSCRHQTGSGAHS